MAALDFPSSPTVGQIATLTNGFSYQWDGAVWALGTVPGPTWSVSGSTLTPTDPTKTVTVSPTVENNPLTVGRRTIKGRLISHPSADITYLSSNLSLNAAGSTFVQDDPTRPSWMIGPDSTNDWCAAWRTPAGGVPTSLLALGNLGVLTMPGDSATQFQAILGTQIAKTRLIASNAAGAWCALSVNTNTYTASQDDATKASWEILLRSDTDSIQFRRKAPSGGAQTVLGTLNASGGFTVPGQIVSGVGIGTATLNPGGASNTGYLAWYNAAGTRCGYMGFGSGTRQQLVCNEGGYTGIDVTGTLGAQLAGQCVQRGNIYPGHAVNYYGSPTIIGAIGVGQNTWTTMASITINTRGGFVLVTSNTGGYTFWGAGSFRYYHSIWRDGSALGGACNSPTSNQQFTPVGSVATWDNPPAGSHTYAIMFYTNGSGMAVPAANDWNGGIAASEIA